MYTIKKQNSIKLADANKHKYHKRQKKWESTAEARKRKKAKRRREQDTQKRTKRYSCGCQSMQSRERWLETKRNKTNLKRNGRQGSPRTTPAARTVLGAECYWKLCHTACHFVSIVRIITILRMVPCTWCSSSQEALSLSPESIRRFRAPTNNYERQS